MSDFFNRDNAYNRFMTRAFDLCLLNGMFFLTSLPLFTMGASLTAVYRVMFAMADNRGGGVVGMYWSEFKANFKKSTLLFLLPAFAFLLLVFDLLYWGQSQESMKTVFFTASVVMLVIWGSWMFWLFPLSAMFENKISTTMLNAGKFALSFAPVTVIASAAEMAFCGLLLFNAALWPFIPVFAISLMLYPHSLYVNRCFKKYKTSGKTF